MGDVLQLYGWLMRVETRKTVDPPFPGCFPVTGAGWDGWKGIFMDKSHAKELS